MHGSIRCHAIANRQLKSDLASIVEVAFAAGEKECPASKLFQMPLKAVHPCFCYNEGLQDDTLNKMFSNICSVALCQCISRLIWKLSSNGNYLYGLAS